MSHASGHFRSRISLLYQLRVRSDFRLSGEEVRGSEFDLEFVRAETDEVCPFDLAPSTLRYKNAAAGVELHEHEAIYCLRYAEIAKFFVFDACRVACHVNPEASETLIVALLQGPVSALVLELRGTVCLHASAVQIDGRAVAFMGNTGAGKSSFAMQFVSRGFPLVTDDILALTVEGEICRAVPAYPEIKLCPDVMARHAADGKVAKQSQTYKPDLRKHLQSVQSGEVGSFANEPMPLAVVYLLEREPQLVSPVMIETIGPSERFVEMLRFSFCARAIGALGLEETRFHRLGRMAELVPVRRLRYSSGIQNFASVCDELLRDLMIQVCRD